MQRNVGDNAVHKPHQITALQITAGSDQIVAKDAGKRATRLHHHLFAQLDATQSLAVARLSIPLVAC